MCCAMQDYNPFGSSYIMEIPDTVVEGHEGLTEGSHEFVVFDKVLLAEAAKAGLYPVSSKGQRAIMCEAQVTCMKPLQFLAAGGVCALLQFMVCCSVVSWCSCCLLNQPTCVKAPAACFTGNTFLGSCFQPVCKPSC